MGEKLVVGVPYDKGLNTSKTAFVIDNNNFPVLVNAYQWRGRVKRKRGTSKLTRLQRIIGQTDGAGNFGPFTILPIPIPTATSVFMIGTEVFVDPGTTANPADQILTTNSLGVTHTLNRVTGVLTITGSTPATNVIFFPGLPVMGIEDLSLPSQAYPGTIGFDTRYSYLVSNIFPYTPSDISFYKNPTSGTYTNYVAKGTPTPTWWNGQNYQQFWSTNYQSAFWATNGITIPFSGTNIGMQFKPITVVDNITPGPPAVARLHIAAHGLVQGDFVFVNEVDTTTGINFQTGYVTSADPQNANFVDVTFPNATIATNGTGGIAQYLTNRSDTTKDCIRWYDGTGWVNFMPPLSQADYSINDVPAAQYYLVGARMIVHFKDRLLFFGPVIQTSAVGATPIYRQMQDVCVYSQNGTAFYTASFAYDPPDILNTSIVFHPILVPDNETATPMAYWEDQTGFGGFQAAGIDQAITTISPNEDSLIAGFNTSVQSRFVYTNNDIIPFNFYTINSELGSSSTFSIVNMDEGVLTRGNRGFIVTAQTNCRRFDLDIPDQVFQVSNSNNGAERFTSQRDFINEWVYFTYPSTEFKNIFPNQTLFYNYRDDSWAIFNECYTTYGIFRPIDGLTWGTIGTKYPTWGSWNNPWGAGASTPLKPRVVGGNQQGYIIERDEGTGEEESLYIQNIVGNLVTSTNHCLNTGDFIIITGALGTIGTSVNGNIFEVDVPLNSTNTFNILSDTTPTGTYLGGGQIIRMYIPKIYSKQFPTAWGLGRKTRIGVQQYLFNRTNLGQVTLQLFLGTNDDAPFNSPPIVPSALSVNNSLIYSTILYTCPESTNLGLTPANTSLLQLTSLSSTGTSSNNQAQMWHRMNTSLIGDTVQFGITLSEEQMRHQPPSQIQFAEIEFHSAILDLSPSGFLA